MGPLFLLPHAVTLDRHLHHLPHLFSCSSCAPTESTKGYQDHAEGWHGVIAFDCVVARELPLYHSERHKLAARQRRVLDVVSISIYYYQMNQVDGSRGTVRRRT